MRSRIILLLAVCSNVTAAGIIRRSGAHAEHHNAARFLNHTEIASNLAGIQTSTPIPFSSLSTPSIVTSSEASIFAAASSAIPTATPLTLDLAASSTGVFSMSTSNQLLSTPVALTTALSTANGSEQSEIGSGTALAKTEAVVAQATETLSRLFDLAGTATNDLQPSNNAPSFSSTPSSKPSASLSTILNTPSTTNIPNVAATSSSSVANQGPFSFEAPLTTSTTASASRVISSNTNFISSSSPDAASQAPSAVVVPVPISSGPVQVAGAGGDTGDEFAPVTLDKSSPAPTGTATYPTAEGGNTAMAAGFNSVYKTLTEDSACNPGTPSQAYACIDGELAECQSDATYVLKSCPQGQSCYALPQPSGSVGVVVQCAVPSDAYSILAGLSSSTTVSSAITSQPLQAGTVLSQATQSVSAQNPVQNAAQPVTSSLLAQATIQSQTVASASTMFAVTASASPDQGVDPAIEPTVSTSAFPISSQSASQNQPQAVHSPALAATTAGAQQVHDSVPPSHTSSKAPESSPPAPSSSAAAVYSVPKALFAVVTATGNDQSSVPTSQPPTAPSSTTSPQGNSADSLQPNEASGTGTSTSASDGDGADSTFAPTGVPVNEKVAAGNGQATVTVTVTVTTTERPAPVTVISSL